jgi:hypothetical protein
VIDCFRRQLFAQLGISQRTDVGKKIITGDFFPPVQALSCKTCFDFSLNVQFGLSLRFFLTPGVRSRFRSFGLFVVHVAELVKGFATNDVAKIDADIAEALNDKVGKAKKAHAYAFFPSSSASPSFC